ncbi:MAG TPA: TIM-barrel domain-containing protein, partial [Terriglobales bacterium]|nr:TIM-barrel domain-containing protein [Terriglobales bacterium]
MNTLYRLFVLSFLLSSSLFAQSQWTSLGNVTAVEKLPDGLELVAQSARIRITALTPNVVRLRYAQDGSFPADHSFAVLPDAFASVPSVQIREAADVISLETGALQVRIAKSPLRLSFLDTQGRVISEDSPLYPLAFNGSAFRVYKSMPLEEHYFGLGDKTGPLDRRELAYTDWNTDMFGFQESTDPIYKSIPFFVGMLKGATYGIFLDNTYRTTFDFGKEFRDAYSFGADGGELNYYFFYGPDPKPVVSDFSALVGRTELPPLFTLAFQQSRYSYYPESQVREIAAEFRKRKIPCDVLYLDIDYQEKNRPFTIDRQRFPHFEQMVTDLKQQGFKLVTITDLHIAAVPNAGYKPYDEGMAHDYFIHNPDGSVYVGPVWPGPSVFPDFTRSVVRDWYGTLYTDFVHMGVRG